MKKLQYYEIYSSNTQDLSKEESIKILFLKKFLANIFFQLNAQFTSGQKYYDFFQIRIYFGEIINGFQLGYSLNKPINYFKIQMIFNQGKSPQKNSEQSCKENQLLQAIGVSSWSELSNRPQLWLYNLGLKQLPDRLCTLMQLQQLFIEGNNIEFLPENIGCLKNLKLLAVDNNQIRSLPQSLSALKDLTLLRIEENKIEIISQSLAELKQLRKFYFHGNPLKHLPSFLQKLPNLECTDMDLQALPQQQYLECPQLSGLKNVEIYIWHLTINEGIKMKMFQQAKPRNLQLYFQSRHK